MLANRSNLERRFSAEVNESGGLLKGLFYNTFFSDSFTCMLIFIQESLRLIKSKRRRGLL